MFQLFKERKVKIFWTISKIQNQFKTEGTKEEKKRVISLKRAKKEKEAISRSGEKSFGGIITLFQKLKFKLIF